MKPVLAVLAVLTILVTGGCSAGPTPILSSPEVSGQPDSTTGATPAPGGGSTPTPGTSPRTAPPPATARPPSMVPVALVGTWQTTVSGAQLTKMLRADATYHETWADATSPCQADGSIVLDGTRLALIPNTTNCAWSAVVYEWELSADGSRLTLVSAEIPQEYASA